VTPITNALPGNPWDDTAHPGQRARFAQTLLARMNGTKAHMVVNFQEETTGKDGKAKTANRHFSLDATAEDAAALSGTAWEELENGCDAYLAVNLFDPDREIAARDDDARAKGWVSNVRKASQVVLVTSLWGDLDKGDTEDDPRPYGQDELDAVVAELERLMPPSARTDSGRGNKQLYWLLTDMLPTVEAQDRAAAVALIAEGFAWRDRVASRVLGRPIRFDSVGSLEHVMRLPGSVRYVTAKKPGDRPVPVRLDYADAGVHYTPEQFREVFAAEPVTAPSVGETVVATFTEGAVTGDPRVAQFLRSLVRKQVEELAAIRVTGMNSGLNKVMYTLGGHAARLDRETVYDAVIGACCENGLLAEDGTGGHNSRSDVDATFESGWSAGLRKPLDLPEDLRDLKERVGVNNPATAAQWLRQELGRGQLSGMFIRDGLLVHTPRVGEDGYVEPTAREKARRIDHGPAQIQPITAEHVKAKVAVAYDVGKEREEDDGTVSWVDAFFPREAAQDSVNAALLGVGCPNLDTLYGVTHTPLLRPDGSILDQPGYDPATGLLYLPDRGLTVPAVPETPTAEQVAAAVALLLEAVAEFPFVADHHRANWLGMMFTPVLRLLLPGPYQMGIITAPNSGSGKGYLAGLIRIVHGMVMRGEMPREKEEMRKTLISALLTTTAPVVGFDNVRGEIYSSELEALLTSETLADRVLGQSRYVTVTNDRLWLVTGNNAKIGGDMARRILEVHIDPHCSDPSARTFTIPDLMGWMEERRGAYLAALLTVARAWVLADAPAEVDRSDNFALWRGSLRGLLHFAGVAGDFGHTDDSDTAGVSEETQEWHAWLEALRGVFGDAPFEGRDVVDALRILTNEGDVYVGGRQEHRLDPAALPGDLLDAWEKARHTYAYGGFTRSLGKWMGNRDGRFTQGLAVRVIRSGKKSARFVVETEAS